MLVSDHTSSCFVLIRITRYALISVPVCGRDWGSRVKCWLLGHEKTQAFRVSYLGSSILLFHSSYESPDKCCYPCLVCGTDWGSGSQMLTLGHRAGMSHSQRPSLFNLPRARWTPSTSCFVNKVLSKICQSHLFTCCPGRTEDTEIWLVKISVSAIMVTVATQSATATLKGP